MSELSDICEKIRGHCISINRTIDGWEKAERRTAWVALLAYAGLAGFGLGVAFTGLLVALAP